MGRGWMEVGAKQGAKEDKRGYCEWNWEMMEVEEGKEERLEM